MKLVILAAAAALLATPALAQVKVGSGSVSNSGAASYAGNSWSTVNKNGIPGASSVVGAVASTPFKCRDMGGISFPYGGIAIPVDDPDCGPIVAAMAWDSCKSPMCQTILSQNRYIRRGLDAQVEARQVQVIQTTGRRVTTTAASGSASYCDPRSRNYAPQLCSGQ
jgi:hypothetical protein